MSQNIQNFQKPIPQDLKDLLHIFPSLKQFVQVKLEEVNKCYNEINQMIEKSIKEVEKKDSPLVIHTLFGIIDLKGQLKVLKDSNYNLLNQTAGQKQKQDAICQVDSNHYKQEQTNIENNQQQNDSDCHQNKKRVSKLKSATKQQNKQLIIEKKQKTQKISKQPKKISKNIKKQYHATKWQKLSKLRSRFIYDLSEE